MSKEQRYKICGDNSGHEYFIRVQDVDIFYKWVDSFEFDFNGEYEGPDFDDNRIDGTFTFTDPRCE